MDFNATITHQVQASTVELMNPININSIFFLSSVLVKIMTGSIIKGNLVSRRKSPYDTFSVWIIPTTSIKYSAPKRRIKTLFSLVKFFLFTLMKKIQIRTDPKILALVRNVLHGINRTIQNKPAVSSGVDSRA